MELLSDGDSVVARLHDKNMSSFYNIAFGAKTRQGNYAHISFSDESLRTKVLYGLAGALVDTFRHGLVLIIDELNQSFHPEFLRLIVELARSEEANVMGGQLIFSAHDTSVMSIMERDELWLVEKALDGSTTLYSLADVAEGSRRSTRRTGAFGKQYLENRFGALPRIDLIRAIRALAQAAKEQDDE